ncbi:MAG: hypothetical protein EON99_00385 [Chitinophagaceae bacterium]|nr:MAG: hypothetical protein EON99_00385 [Chitinophagaceae bacterium]
MSRIGDQDNLIARSINLLLQAINENRRLSKRLSAPTLGNLRLADSVRELVEMVAATRKFELTLDTDSINDLETSEELHLTVYRIIQEQLTNISRYAEASHAQVILDRKDQSLTLEIKDDGKGFDPLQKRNGIGITNMIMRAENIDGELLIDSVPGRGCILTAWFPLQS